MCVTSAECSFKKHVSITWISDMESKQTKTQRSTKYKVYTKLQYSGVIGLVGGGGSYGLVKQHVALKDKNI
jgi:hypothetical protein